MNFDERSLTDAVLARIDESTEPRLRRVMTSLVRHLHDFVREVELTEEEWMSGIRFLTETGQKCDDKRQEFILLSDTLGVSMLVDAINHRFPEGATQTTVFGPFYVSGAPEVPHWADIAGVGKGLRCYVSGRVLDTAGRPIEGAIVDVWQAEGEEGFYDVQQPEKGMYCRGRIRTDAQGRYAFRTVQPTSYPVPTDGPVGAMLLKLGRHPFRPAHIHTMISREGYRTLTTHIFVKGDPYLGSDAVFGVKDSLVVEFLQHPPGPAPDASTSELPFSTASFDFRLAPAQPPAPGLSPEATAR